MPKQNSRVSGGKPRTSTQSGAAFHKDVQQPDPKAQAAPEFDPTRPATFDLSGFISGARTHVSTRTVPVTSRPDIAGELAALTYERDRIVEVIEEDKTTEGGTRKRVSAKTARSRRLQEIDERIGELQPELDGTYVLVKIRAMSPVEQDEIRQLRMPPGIDLAGQIFHLGAVIRSEDSDDDAWSTLSAEQWTEFFEAIGIDQYNTLDKTFESITYQGVTPDFYERYSASRRTRSTSSS